MKQMRDILDLDRYPLDKPGSAAWLDLVSQCRADLAHDGIVPGGQAGVES